MTIKVNGKDYSENTIHNIFADGRQAIADHNIDDSAGYIKKTLGIMEHMVITFCEFF